MTSHVDLKYRFNLCKLREKDQKKQLSYQTVDYRCSLMPQSMKNATSVQNNNELHIGMLHFSKLHSIQFVPIKMK